MLVAPRLPVYLYVCANTCSARAFSPREQTLILIPIATELLSIARARFSDDNL